jgi:pyruvate/2-oxoglutarate dehydrogenase complex dihydrolipoamide acyltransferase (E2) component
MMNEMTTQEHRDLVPLVAPDLRVAAVAVSLWLVAEGAEVVEGDRVVELVAGGVTVDLGAPVTGRLVRHLVDEDTTVAAGAILAEFEAAL